MVKYLEKHTTLISSWATHMPAPFIWEEGRSRHQLKKHTRKQESLKAILRCPFHCQGFQNGSGQDREGTLERRHCIAMIGKFHAWMNHVLEHPSSWATHMPAPFIWEEGRSRHQLKKHTRKQESLKAILRCPFHCPNLGTPKVAKLAERRN